MYRKIAGGVITLVIGGTAYSVSQTDVARNFANNTGMSQQQSQQYVNNINQSDLQTFSKLGAGMVDDGNSINDVNIDCSNYTYPWVTASLTCISGKSQLHSLANDEIKLGNCYLALDTNLGNSSKSKVNECIVDIDMLVADYKQPIVNAILDSKNIADGNNSNVYNKSVLQAALTK